MSTEPRHAAESADNREQQKDHQPLQAPRNVGKPPIAPDDPEPGAGTDLAMPHERDESVRDTAAEPNPVIVQAHQDIVSGQVDTDLHNEAGLDAPRREELLGDSNPARPKPTR